LSQPPLLLRNRGDGTFDNATPTVGAAFNRPVMARGAAHADFDGDGDPDIAISTLNGPALLLRNDRTEPHRWLRVRTVGSRSNRSGIGTVVRVTSASGTQTQTVRSGSSYASQSELTLTFGLGRDPRVSAIAVEWPSGQKQTFADLAPNQVVVIDEARGLLLSGQPGASPSPADRARPR
jgi:hypothetical protein